MDIEERFAKTSKMLEQYEKMLDLSAEKIAEERAWQSAFKAGWLMSEMRMMAFRYPKVAEDLEQTLRHLEKKYVVDTLKTDAIV